MSLDSDFIYYWLQGSESASQINVLKGQTDMADYLSLRDQRAMQMTLPPPFEQRRIAWVLGSLDDKIELNRRMARTLEETAAAIFKARFVDFVGVDDFEDSEVGPIPKGWHATPLDRLAEFVNGGAFTKGAEGTGRPVIRIRELNNGRVAVDTPRSEREVEEKHLAREFDLLFSWSGSLNLYRWSGPESLINQHIFKVLPLSGVPSWFIEEATNHHLPHFRQIAAEKATTMGHIQRRHLTEALVATPPADVLEGADRLVGPIFENRRMTAAQIRTLTALRDELLPKLISGKIRVPEGVCPDTDPDEVLGELAESAAEVEIEPGEGAVVQAG